MTLIVLFWVSAVTALRAKIVGSTSLHWTYSCEIYYGDFTLKNIWSIILEKKHSAVIMLTCKVLR